MANTPHFERLFRKWAEARDLMTNHLRGRPPGSPIGAACGVVAVAAVTVAMPGCRDTGPSGEPREPFRAGVTIEVGAAPHGIRFSADGDTAYVALSGDGQIAVVDLAAGAVAAPRHDGTAGAPVECAGRGLPTARCRCVRMCR